MIIVILIANPDDLEKDIIRITEQFLLPYQF